jgi:HlyD family secretion protein
MQRAYRYPPDPSRRTGDDPKRLIKAFGSDAGEIHAELDPVKPRMAVFVLAAMVVAFLAIGAVFDIDRIVESQQGQVVTVQPTIALQALDTSIIRSIDVEEGQIVKPGQLLETLDPTFAAADVAQLKSQIASLDAQITRDEVELAGRPLEYPPSSDPTELKYRALQLAYHEQRMRQYDEQIKAFDEQIALSHATIEKMKNDEARLTDRSLIAERVQKMWTDLLTKDSGSQLQALQAKDAAVQIRKDLEFDQNSVLETEHGLAAAVANREAFIQQWLGLASQDLVTSRNARDAAVELYAKAARHSDLVRVTAPDDCIVLRIPKVSVGSVVKTGDHFMTLALMTVPIEAEISVLPRDIGFVRKGDEVTLKLDAYEFVEHGTATGRVRWISEGTFTDDLISGDPTVGSTGSTQPYFKVRVELTEMKFFNVPSDFRLLPGMTLSADIHVGKRSLLRYLFKGIVRTGFESMREPE